MLRKLLAWAKVLRTILVQGRCSQCSKMHRRAQRAEGESTHHKRMTFIYKAYWMERAKYWEKKYAGVQELTKFAPLPPGQLYTVSVFPKKTPVLCESRDNT
jgi:hypothetical protein